MLEQYNDLLTFYRAVTDTTIKIRNNPGLPCISPCLGYHQQRGENWRKFLPGCSGYVQGDGIKKLCTQGVLQEIWLVEALIFFFFFFTSIVTAVLSHCELTHIHKNKWDYTSSYFLKILGGLGLVFLSYICKACKTDISSVAKASGCQTCSRCVHINLKISFKPSLLYKNQLIYWDNRSKYQKE